jgi:hypothetical protein
MAGQSDEPQAVGRLTQKHPEPKMTNNSLNSKARLLEDIEKSWESLEIFLSPLSETQITTVRDNSGWTIKDHLAHLEAWENSVVYFLLDKPRSEGLGIEETLFVNGTIDEINKIIHNSRRGQSYGQITNQLKTTHKIFLSLIKSLTDTELTQPPKSSHPVTTTDSNRKVVDIIRDNSSGHIVEHLDWLKAMV